MTCAGKSLVALVAAPFVVAGLVACGENGQSIGEGQCPVLPVYHWAYFDAGGWRKVTPSGTPPDQTAIDQATKDQPPNGRCQTPAGVATTIGAGTGGATGAGGKTGTGGSKAGAGGARDAGKD